jgi:multiple sugar transport system ATP-binding protein
VRDNLAFGLRRRAVPRAEIARRVDEVAAALGLSALLDRRPHALSGGQRQRVALGRAIVRDPKVFLFDEPLSNLDAALRASTRQEIANLHRRLGATMIYVTHDQVEAMTLGDRICVMHDGKVSQIGKPLDVYRKPENVFVARFLGSPPMNVVPARLAPGEGIVARVGGGALPVLGFAPDATGPFAQGEREILLGVRPEDLTLVEPGAGTPTALVEAVEQLGAETILTASLDGTPIALRAPRDLRATPGERIGLAAGSADLHLFEPETGAVLARA